MSEVSVCDALEEVVEARFRAAQIIRRAYAEGKITLEELTDHARDGIPVTVIGTAYVTVTIELETANTGEIELGDLDIAIPKVGLVSGWDEVVSVEAVGMTVDRFRNA
jgi:hypothetical protein